VRQALTSKQVASALHYCPKAVEVYPSRIYARTQCSTRVELVRTMGGGGLELLVE
jgi:DNA-binding NarL/FixJ family response regulator